MEGEKCVKTYGTSSSSYHSSPMAENLKVHLGKGRKQDLEVMKAIVHEVDDHWTNNNIMLKLAVPVKYTRSMKCGSLPSVCIHKT